MADFSTDFSQAQGAGANPLSPVRPAEGNAPNPWVGLASSVVDAFSKYSTEKKKQEALDMQNGVISSFVREQTAINDAVSTGQMDRMVAATRQRAIVNKYYANYPTLVKDLQDVNKDLLAGTELGINKELETAEMKREQELESRMVQAGIPYSSTLPANVKEQLKTTFLLQEGKMRSWEQMSKIQTHNVAMTEADKRIQDAANKEKVGRDLGEIGQSYVDSSIALATTVAMEPNKEEASKKVLAHFATVKANIARISQQFPEQASNWNKIFDDLEKVSLESTKPGADVDKLKAQYEALSYKARITYISDPKIAAKHAVSMVTPQVAAALAPLSWEVDKKEVANATAMITGELNTNHPVVGTGNTERGVYKTFETTMNALDKGTILYPDAAKEQLKVGMDNIFRQVSLAPANEKQAADLKNAFDFISSPTYDRMNKMGLITPAKALEAKQIFETVYMRDVAEKINDKLGKTAYGNVTYGDLMEFKNEGGIVTMRPLDRVLSPEMAKERAQVMADTKLVVNKLNELVRAGAHLSGSNDYQGYWEQAKSQILPQYFTPEGEPKRVNGREVRGQIVQKVAREDLRKGIEIGGYVYQFDDGGAQADNPKAWKPKK